MTYSDDLCRRLLIIAHRIGEQDVERGAIAIEALEADNAALREELEWYQQNSGVTRDSRYAAIDAAMREGKE